MRITIAEPSSDLSPLAEEAMQREHILADASELLVRLGRVIDRYHMSIEAKRLALEMLSDEFADE